VADWGPINAAASWEAVLVAEYSATATEDGIRSFLDDKGSRRGLPAARLETDFRNRTLTVRLESPTTEGIEAWSAALRSSEVIAAVRSA